MSNQNEHGGKAVQDFLAEAEEIIDRLSLDMVTLSDSADSGDCDPDTVNAIFRGAHSLKGLAGMFGFSDIAELSHNLENLLDSLRLGKIPLSPRTVAVLFESMDFLARLVRNVGTSEGDTFDLEPVIARQAQPRHQHHAAVAARPDMNLSQLTLLVVDNAVSVRSALAHQLELAGFGRVLQAHNHERALAHLRGGGVDLVLSELAAPTDGLALLEAVRGDHLLAPLPLMLMSGELNRAAVQRAIALGICDLLVKPFTTQRVIERVLKALERGNVRAVPNPPAAAAAPAEAPAEAPERATILVVDDTPENLQLLAGLFRDSFKVKLANNGEKALAICRSDAPPDLILLDVMMPDMDGFEVARQVREHHASSHTPIIFVSAMTDDASRQKGLALGAIDYVAKPIDPDLLRLRVNNLLQFVEHRKQMQTDFDRQREIADLRREVERLRSLLPAA